MKRIKAKKGTIGQETVTQHEPILANQGNSKVQ